MYRRFVGGRLRQLRLINEKSLQNVGDVLAMTKQYTHTLETEEQPPAEITKRALADYFGVSKSFFLQEYNHIYEKDCYFRKAKSIPVSVKEKARQYVSLLDEYVQFLDEGEFDLPKISFLPEEIDYAKLTALDIENFAEKLRQEWGLDIDTPIDNVTKSLENAGAIVTCFADLSDKVGTFSINRKRPIVIINNEKYNSCRLRFDLAHECGHLVLHKYGDSTEDAEIKEEQANRFASALLLPRKGFYQEFYSVFIGKSINWLKMSELKERWKVSFALIIRRAYDLNIIDAVKYRNAYVYLRKSGQSKIERGDDTIALEKVSLLKNVTKELIEKNIENLMPFITDKGWSGDLFERVTSFDGSEIKKYMTTHSDAVLPDNVVSSDDFKFRYS